MTEKEREREGGWMDGWMDRYSKWAMRDRLLHTCITLQMNVLLYCALTKLYLTAHANTTTLNLNCERVSDRETERE